MLNVFKTKVLPIVLVLILAITMMPFSPFLDKAYAEELEEQLNAKFYFAKVYDKTEVLLSESDLEGGIGLKAEFLRKIKGLQNFSNTKVIVTTNVHDKSAILSAGADLYLPKPYEISDLIRWVEYFIS